MEANTSSITGNESYDEVDIPALKRFVDTTSIDYVLGAHIQQRCKRDALNNADNYYLQGWFSKISWSKKIQFIMKVIRSISDLGSLKLIISALKSLTKDFCYSTSQCTKFSYDIIPNDDDRSLNRFVLAEVMESELEWLKSIDEEQKCSIILDLIKMSGSGLAAKALSEAQTLSDIFEFIEYLEKFIPDEISQNDNEEVNDESNDAINHNKFKKTSGLGRIILSRIAKNKRILPLFNMHKACSVLKPNVSKNPEIINLLKTVKNKESLWDMSLRKMLLTVHSGEIEDIVKPRITTSAVEVDQFQLLPLMINKQIIKNLDNESKRALSRVDYYWNNAIEEEAKENEVRKHLNKVIQKLEVKLLNSKLPGGRFTALMKKKKKSTSADGRKGKKRKKVLNDLKSLCEDDFKESIYTLLKKQPKSRHPFRGAYRGMSISTAYMYDRVIDCTKKWVACTENTSVVFYNLVTGAKASTFTISGHSLVITCVAFFPRSFRLATGSLDKTIKTWDIWNKRELETYEGHTDVILSISVNEEYIASCARDSTIRIFSQLSGFTIKLVNSSKWTPTMLLLTLDNLVYWVNAEGSLKMFSITDESIDNTVAVAHKSGATFVGKYGPVIITYGADCFVRLWNANLKNEKCLTEFYHEIIVNSALISHMTAITACADGCLRFWDVGNGKLIRTITVNMSHLPILSICIQNYYNHVKILCNNEFNLYALEFMKKWVKASRKTNPYQGILLHPIRSTKQKHNEDKRLFKMHKRKCTLPQLRYRENYKTFYNYKSVLKKSIGDNRLIELFPRYTEFIPESS